MTSFPALASDLFRNDGGNCTVISGSLDRDVEIANWISDIETIEAEGVLEEVNIDGQQNIITKSEDEAENTHLLREGKYHCTADLIFDWFGFGRTSKSVVD